MRITVIVPIEKMGIANDLAMILGESPADAYTFSSLTVYKDAEGNAYSVASWEDVPRELDGVVKDWMERVQDLQLPDYCDSEECLQRAQEAAELLQVGGTVGQDHITVLYGENIFELMQEAGIVRGNY